MEGYRGHSRGNSGPPHVTLTITLTLALRQVTLQIQGGMLLALSELLHDVKVAHA